MPHLDHVTITAPDFAAAFAFYDAALSALGLARVDELVDEEEDDPDVDAAGWGVIDGPAVLWLVRGERPTGGLHLAFRVDARVDVETFHRVALEAGGTSRHAPRRWPLYRVGEFSAIVADPAGNLLEAVGPE